VIKLIAKLFLFAITAVAAVEVARRTKVVERVVDKAIDLAIRVNEPATSEGPQS